MKADLHLHSTASDGELSPEEVVKEAARLGMTHIALTDHDSISGWPEAKRAASCLGVMLLPGVELSCGAEKEIHILGYGFDPSAPSMRTFCAARTMERAERAKRMVAQLEQTGASIALSRVMELARGVVARPHVARALVEAGYATSVKDAFERYLMPGKPGYVPKREVTVAQAVGLIAESGGVSVLAHPMQLKMGMQRLEAVVHEWHAEGLDGLEAFHPSAIGGDAVLLERLARREGLLVTGGSDFHGPSVRPTRIGEGLERWGEMREDVNVLLNLIKERAAAREGKAYANDDERRL